MARAVFFSRSARSAIAASSISAIRANGLNLVVTAIVQWNTVYLQRAVQTLADDGQTIDEADAPPLAAAEDSLEEEIDFLAEMRDDAGES